MTKKKWSLVIVLILLGAGCLKLFYKTYSESVIAKDADCVIAIDVKRITNTFLWNFLTTPSQWKKISFSSSGKVSWRDMVEMPDYIFLFHSKGHPANAWYSVLEIDDEKDFNEGLQNYHFIKSDNVPGLEEYVSRDLGVAMIRYGKKVLIGNAKVEDNRFIREIANKLFVEKQYMSRLVVEKNIKTRSHFSLQLTENNFLKEGALISANFNNNAFVADAFFTPREQFHFAEHNFSYRSNSLFATGFTQPPAPVYRLLKDSAKSQLSKAVNFNVDSLLLQSNAYYSLDIQSIKPAIDSAISYVYDDEFNPVEKVVVNQIWEPSFSFSVEGDSIHGIYQYWKKNGVLETTSGGDLFLPLPFVRSYCKKDNEKKLSVVSNNYLAEPANKNLNCIFFLDIQLAPLPPALLKYLPDEVIRTISNIESMLVTARKNNEQIHVHCIFNKKKNDLPVINW